VIAVDVAGIHPVRPHLAPLDGGAHGEGRRVVAEPHAADAPRRALLLLSAEVDLLVRPPAVVLVARDRVRELGAHTLEELHPEAELDPAVARRPRVHRLRAAVRMEE